MLGAGFITTCVEDILVKSAMELAVTVAVKAEETDDGGLYFAVVVVEFVMVPQAAPLHAVPETFQVTPMLVGSFATVAVKFTVCPRSMAV
jgi:hypothetical protein